MNEKTLFITPKFPSANMSGGLIKTKRLIEKLSMESKLTVLCLYDEGGETQFGQGEIRKIIVTNRSGPRSISFLSFLESILKRRPLAIQRNYFPQLVNKVADIYKEYDHIILDHHLLGYSIPDYSKFYYHSHNAEFKILETYISQCLSFNLLKKTVAYFERYRLFAYEERLINRAYKVFAAPPDIEVFKNSGMDGRFVETYHLGDPVELDRDLLFNQRNPNIVVLGSCSWFPNLDGLEWFVSDVWPRVRRSVPASTLLIVGQQPSSIVARFSGIEGVELLGYVDSLESIFSESRAGIVPIRIGAGMKVKLFTYAGARLPIVSTEHGVEGVSKEIVDQMAVTDDAKTFAEYLIRILGDGQFWNELRCVSQKISEKYTWEKVLAKFWNEISEN